MAESVKKFNTGEFAVMNCAASAFDAKSQTTTIAAGHNEKCQLYTCQLAREIIEEENKTNGVINRKSSPSPKDLNSRLTFQVRPGKAVQTDFKYIDLSHFTIMRILLHRNCNTTRFFASEAAYTFNFQITNSQCHNF